MQRTSNFIVLLEPGAATEDFGQPKLAYGSLHVLNLALDRGGSLDPLRGLATNTAYHVGMGQGLGCSLDRLQVESRGDGLSDA